MRRTAIGQFLRAGPNVVSRRRFFSVGAGAAGGVLGSGLWTPVLGDHHADDRRRNDHEDRDDHDDDDRRREAGGRPCPEQNPIPRVSPVILAGFGAAFHVFFPGPVDGSPADTDPEPAAAHVAGRDPSTIFDFDGVIGEADLSLTGIGTDTTTGVSAHYGFNADMRLMMGRFVATDGGVHRGAFAFI